MKIDNSEKFYFSDFTHGEYRKLLREAKIKFDFIRYDEIQKHNNEILWRHDVDFSVHEALNLAMIEKEEGVKATYFFMLHNEFYNIFEREISNLVLRIKELGHSIALHFDPHYYHIVEMDDLAEYLSFEKSILDKLFDIDVKVFSFHNTNEFTMSCKNWEYGGLINTYAEYFQSEVKYCSDSNGYWRFERLKDVLMMDMNKPLQILTHPEWWTDKIMSPKQKVNKCINGRASSNLLHYENNLMKFKRENIDW